MARPILPLSHLMNMYLHSSTRSFAVLLLSALALALPWPAAAGDSEHHKYTAVLIWGTDGQKPDEQNFKEVPKELAKKFHLFKWKNYFEVTRKDVDLKVGESKNVELSEKCEVKLHLTQKQELEIELFGEKKSVYKGTQSMPLKDELILGGDIAKNSTAWFVVLKPRK